MHSKAEALLKKQWPHSHWLDVCFVGCCSKRTFVYVQTKL